MTIPEFRAASSRAKNLPLNHNAFRAPSAKDIKKNRTLLFGGNLRGDLHGYPENSGLLWREKLLFEQRLILQAALDLSAIHAGHAPDRCQSRRRI